MSWNEITSLPVWEQFSTYFFSIYGNTILQLLLFTILLFSIFYARNVRLHLRIKKARRSTGFFVGGWGSRGKSGTERIKAALFEALGHGYVSKSTGCEAMFLHAYPFSKTREMFLFRPYDKATIWEHHNLIVLSDRLKNKVFIWECMGLTPEYVDILQHKWSQDDLSTVTNTYPDHEDLQGPAGVNIPHVMKNFIPIKGKLLTTEEEMTPILRDGCRELETEILEYNWLQSELITDDILELFPYQEHPNNIALVVGMAQQIGINDDYALREMAKRVIADIGVLKTYPVSTIRGRKLEFVNGMSANERFGTMGNWTRTGFDKTHPKTEPSKYLVTVINNRADRIARSKVFASIVAEDLSADNYILIGSNLNGLEGYIKESWSHRLATLNWENPFDPATNSWKPEILDLLKFSRVLTQDEDIQAVLTSILDNLSLSFSKEEIEAIIEDSSKISSYFPDLDNEIKESLEKHIKKLKTNSQNWREISSKVKTGANETIVDELKQFFSDIFFEKIKIVDDFHASGNQVIDYVVNYIPPGLFGRVMGMQNIKGTGLDFIYRFQAWEKCHEILEKLQSTKPVIFEEGLQEISLFQEFGILTHEPINNVLTKIKENEMAQTEKSQAIIQLVLQNDSAAMEKIQQAGGKQKKNNLWSSIMEQLESFLDIGDAVTRRKTVNQIYEDLVNQRISHDRAALELMKINKRQKGGWLQG